MVFLINFLERVSVLHSTQIYLLVFAKPMTAVSQISNCPHY